MHVNPSIVKAARLNGEKRLAQSGSPGEKYSQPDAVVDLLTNSTSPAAQPAARKLLKEMSCHRWSVIRGVHKSTKGDRTPHVTIEVSDRRYHLRLDRGDCIFDITTVMNNQTVRLAGFDPWTSPGAS